MLMIMNPIIYWVGMSMISGNIAHNMRAVRLIQILRYINLNEYITFTIFYQSNALHRRPKIHLRSI